MSAGYQRCAQCKGPEDDMCPRPVLINTCHTDGPFVYWCDGRYRWLTFWERVKLFRGKLNVWKLKP